METSERENPAGTPQKTSTKYLPYDQTMCIIEVIERKENLPPTKGQTMTLANAIAIGGITLMGIMAVVAIAQIIFVPLYEYLTEKNTAK